MSIFVNVGKNIHDGGYQPSARRTRPACRTAAAGSALAKKAATERRRENKMCAFLIFIDVLVVGSGFRFVCFLSCLGRES